MVPEVQPALSMLARFMAKLDLMLGITATKVPPSPATGLTMTAMTPTSIQLKWTAPKVGTQPIRYTVFMKKRTDMWWAVGATSTVTSATITGLAPGTVYDFEIFSHNN